MTRAATAKKKNKIMVAAGVDIAERREESTGPASPSSAPAPSGSRQDHAAAAAGENDDGPDEESSTMMIRLIEALKTLNDEIGEEKELINHREEAYLLSCFGNDDGSSTDSSKKVMMMTMLKVASRVIHYMARMTQERRDLEKRLQGVEMMMMGERKGSGTSTPLFGLGGALGRPFSLRRSSSSASSSSIPTEEQRERQTNDDQDEGEERPLKRLELRPQSSTSSTSSLQDLFNHQQTSSLKPAYPWGA